MTEDLRRRIAAGLAPAITLGGTSREVLANALQTALDAHHAAVKALEEAEPNGRDYRSPAAFQTAQRIHHERLARLTVNLNELLLQLEDVLDQ